VSYDEVKLTLKPFANRGAVKQPRQIIEHCARSQLILQRQDSLTGMQSDAQIAFVEGLRR
jgi:hypothetical protein